MKMGAVEAANEIRNTVFSTHMDPAEQHHVRFVQDVCAQLMLEGTLANLYRVGSALHQHGIDITTGLEYPKYAVRGHDKAQKIVHDEQEEHDWANEEPAPPSEPVGKVIEDHPAPDLDLREQVPQQAHDEPEPELKANRKNKRPE